MRGVFKIQPSNFGLHRRNAFSAKMKKMVLGITGRNAPM
jgi:hypothetical protein